MAKTSYATICKLNQQHTLAGLVRGDMTIDEAGELLTKLEMSHLVQSLDALTSRKGAL